MEKIMILGAGPLQLPAIKIAKKLGLYVYVCDYDSNAIGFKYADEHFVISTIDKEKVLEKAKELNPDYIITSTSDAPVKTVAYVCEKLSKKIDISYENAICATEKWAMRDRLKDFNIPIPKYYKCFNYKDFYDAVCSLNFNCIIKPSDSAASRGVQFISSDKNLENKYNDCCDFSRNGIVMVEELMQGSEVSVESFIVNGKVNIITITDKLVTRLPYFVELGHSEPSLLPVSIQTKIKEITINAIKAIGIKNGVSHTEVMVTKEGPKIVEIAARLGGDYITSKLVPLSTGVDMVENSIRLSIGKSIDIEKKFSKGSAIRFITADPGVIDSIYVPNDIYSIPGFFEMELFAKVGDVVKEVKSSNDRLGYIITCCDTPKDAIKLADSILSMIKIQTKKQIQ